MYMDMLTYIFIVYESQSQNMQPSQPAKIDSKEDPTARVYRLGVESICTYVA